MPKAIPTEKSQHFLNNSIILCLGLFPALHLSALQLAALLVLIGAGLNAKTLFTTSFRLRWHHLAMSQFLLFSLLNTFYFPSLEGNRLHYKPVAIEALCLSVLLIALLAVFKHNRPAMEQAWKNWLPVGLIASFLIVSLHYFSPMQEGRIQAFTPNALIPPMWFLTLTLISFCNFSTMSMGHKALRMALFSMAGLMAIYSGGRLSLIVWLISAVFLIFHYLPKADPQARKKALVLGAAGLSVMLICIFAIDYFKDGTMLFRLRYTVDALLSGQASDRFLRLEIWSAAWQLILERPMLGHGQVNERVLLHQILNEEWWFRSHQTYLSYWIGGGMIGLISGLVFQLSAGTLSAPALRPAAFGLIGILGLHGLTESVFQSFVAVQMLIFLVMLRAPSER